MFPYLNHLQSSDELVTTYEATRAGFVALALEKNHRATPYVAEARTLANIASTAKSPTDLLKINGIETGLLTAAGLSDKTLSHLSPSNREEAVQNLIKNFLEHAGKNFIGSAIEKKMATEIWNQLENGLLKNAANLNQEDQMIAVVRWLCAF